MTYVKPTRPQDHTTVPAVEGNTAENFQFYIMPLESSVMLLADLLLFSTILLVLLRHVI